jgi:parallel beta-helix repeat protein
MNQKLSFLIILMLSFVVVSSMTLKASAAEANIIFYIRADGSIDPPTTDIITSDHVTYALVNDINGSIVVERSCVIDGQGHTLQGIGATGSAGISASYMDSGNVTIENMTIKGFDKGIDISVVRFVYVIGNKIIENRYGIAFSLWYCMISQNSIENNSLYGIYFNPQTGYPDNVNVVGNNVTGNNDGIEIFSMHATVSENNITANLRNGISVIDTSGPNIGDNRISDNGNCGIFLHSSSDCQISANTITNNGNSTSGAGIWLELSDHNIIHSNSFLQNYINAYTVQSYSNSWDVGQSIGGNYWSNYTGMDMDEDGVGDTPYVIDVDNVDNFPLMGKESSILMVEATYEISVSSNSPILDLQFSLEPYVSATVSLNVSEGNGTKGFCRIVIPKAVINGTYEVKLDGVAIVYPQVKELPYTDEQYETLYINYTQTEHVITINGPTTIPEFPLSLMLPLFFIATLLSIMFYRTKKGRTKHSAL